MSVPSLPRTGYNLQQPAPNDGKKRRRIGSPPGRNMRQRTQRQSSSPIDITSLSTAQVATLSEAASILQLPTSALLDLVPKPQRKANGRKIRPRRFSSEMAGSESHAIGTPRTSSFQSRSITHSNNTPPFSNPLPDMCSMPALAFGLIPKQIADCFANFSPSVHEAPTNVQYTDKANFQTPTESSNSPYLEMSRTQSSAIFSHDAQVQPYDTMNLQNVYDSSLPHGGFACNEFVSSIVGWQALIGTQPPSAIASMSYPSGTAMDQLHYSPTYNDVDINNFGDYSGSYTPDESSDLIDLSPETSLESFDSDSSDQNCAEKPGPTPRRPFQSSYDRQQTALTRKNTACLRCRMQRIRCQPDPTDPAGVCLTCKRVTKPKMSKLPCLRYKLADVRLFREGSFAAGHEWSHRWSGKKIENITGWASSNITTIYVTQDYGDSAIAVKVGQFIPVKGDMLHRQWADGSIIKSVPIPNYAIVDMGAALRAYKAHIVNDGPKYFKSALNFNDRLLWDTYSVVMDYSKTATTEEEQKLLQMVLQLWVTVRMCTKSQRISGSETLGMSTNLMDSSSPMHGKIPVPPVLSAQVSFIVVEKLQIPLRTRILDLLQKLTLAQKPSNWFCIYLCTFILLHNCSLLTDHDMGYARKHGLKRLHARPDMIKELHHGANVLLAHFHYCCKGFRPFTLNWNPAETVSMAEMDVKQVRFVRQTAVYVNINELFFKRLLHEGSYNNEHYFVAQLYEEHWQPRSNA